MDGWMDGDEKVGREREWGFVGVGMWMVCMLGWLVVWLVAWLWGGKFQKPWWMVNAGLD